MTPLERRFPKDPEEEGHPATSPVWVNRALDPLRSTTDPSKFGGPQQMNWRVQLRGGYARNLREDWDFLTVPPNGEEVMVSHLLPGRSVL